MGRKLAIALLLACAATAARGGTGLGVFANGVELSKDPSWSADFVRYDSGNDVFVLTSRVDFATGIPQLTLSGTNLVNEVAFAFADNLQLPGVKIRNLQLRTTTTNRSPFRITPTQFPTLFSTVLILSGKNRFEAGPQAAGLQLGSHATLVITNAPDEEAASLVAIGGDGGAGIGNGYSIEMSRSLSIAGGVIEARGGKNANGIGDGGCDGGIGELIMTGGTVKAVGDGKADIGFSGTPSTITGGSLGAVDYSGATPGNGHGPRVARFTIHNPAWTNGTPVRPTFVGSNASNFSYYGTNGIFADENGNIHLWILGGRPSIVLDGILLEADLPWRSCETNLAAVVFEDWCAAKGIVGERESITDGQPNLLRFAFDCPDGPLPMPTFDLSCEVPVVVMPYLRNFASVAPVGSEDLSAPPESWRRLRRRDDDTTRWLWTGDHPFPSALFIRYKAEY